MDKYYDRANTSESDRKSKDFSLLDDSEEQKENLDNA